jgi:5'-nucleotidase
MVILLTNDDGIESSRLHFTKQVLSKFGTVYLVAPKTEQSAKSMSLTVGGFEYEKIDDFTYSISGTPVDCVNFAFGGLNLRPDITVSGTNKGYNLGFDTKYSGTVGACFQAQYFGCKSIALSADREGKSILENELEDTLNYIFDNNLLSEKHTLNVNFAQEKFGKSKGILETSVQYYNYDYCPDMTENHYKPNRSFIVDFNLTEQTDIYAYAKGYTSISKIKI